MRAFQIHAPHGPWVDLDAVHMLSKPEVMGTLKARFYYLLGAQQEMSVYEFARQAPQGLHFNSAEERDQGIKEHTEITKREIEKIWGEFFAAWNQA